MNMIEQHEYNKGNIGYFAGDDSFEGAWNFYTYWINKHKENESLYQRLYSGIWANSSTVRAEHS